MLKILKFTTMIISLLLSSCISGGANDSTSSLSSSSNEQSSSSLEFRRPVMSENIVALKVSPESRQVGELESIAIDNIEDIFEKYSSTEIDTTCNYYVYSTEIDNDVDFKIIEIDEKNNLILDYLISPLDSINCRKGLTVSFVSFLIKDCSNIMNSNFQVEKIDYADSDMRCEPKNPIIDSILVQKLD